MKRALLCLLAASLLLTACQPLFTPLDNTLPESLPSSSPASSSELLPESSESSISEPESDPYLGAPIPQNSDSADDSYFDDAIFIGDSLTYGLSAYEILDSNLVLADIGINPNTILTSACIVQDGQELTIREALQGRSPAKIYLMLGANGVGFLSQEDFIAGYSEFVDALQQDHPDTTIYLQSILPVTAEKSSDTRYANDKIMRYNDAILALASEKGVYYLDVSEAFRDETGAMPASLSGDGMHIGPNSYRVWLDYLLCHRAE